MKRAILACLAAFALCGCEMFEDVEFIEDEPSFASPATSMAR